MRGNEFKQLNQDSTIPVHSLDSFSCLASDLAHAVLGRPKPRCSQAGLKGNLLIVDMQPAETLRERVTVQPFALRT